MFAEASNAGVVNCYGGSVIKNNGVCPKVGTKDVRCLRAGL